MGKKGLFVALLCFTLVGIMLYIRFAEDYGYPPIELGEEYNEIQQWAKDPEIASTLYAVLTSSGIMTYLITRRIKPQITPVLKKIENPQDPYKKFEEKMAQKNVAKPKIKPQPHLQKKQYQEKQFRSLTTGRFSITDREKVEEYFRTLGPMEIAELHKYGVDYYPASKSWRIPPDLSHLPKEVVWKMLAVSYNDAMRPGWRDKIEYKTKKAFGWLFNPSS